MWRKFSVSIDSTAAIVRSCSSGVGGGSVSLDEVDTTLPRLAVLKLEFCLRIRQMVYRNCGSGCWVRYDQFSAMRGRVVRQRPASRVRRFDSVPASKARIASSQKWLLGYEQLGRLAQLVSALA